MEPVVIIEKNIPFAKGLLEAYARVRYLAPEEIDESAMADADALITRTRTRCDRGLLEGSRCKIIASATIGLDHVDTVYCRQAGIKVTNAPGCNAPAVAQYVLASIIAAKGADLSGITLGVVGVGHVGSIVADWARQLGMKVLCCDPPRARNEGDGGFVALDDIAAQADVITFHVPYTRSGADATHYLCGSDFLSKLQCRPIIINSARGAVTDTKALLDAYRRDAVSGMIIDCWENEPNIDYELLDNAFVATPHIAGYSREGKIRATAMAVKQVCDFFGWPEPVMPEKVAPGAADKVTVESIASSYDPLKDTEALRAAPQDFERQRNGYILRHEVV